MHKTEAAITNRWIVLGLGTVTELLVIGLPSMCMPVLFKEISDELNLSLVQIGTVWGLFPFAGLITGLLGGLMSDRIGVKKFLVIGCIIAGMTGALRGLSSDFISFAITSFLSSVLITAIPVCVHKLVNIWFSGKQRGLAQGVVGVGLAIGTTTGAMISASIMSPLLGGWRNVLFLYGVIAVLVGILWLVLKGQPHQEKAAGTTSISIGRALASVARIKGIWILGLILLGYAGCYQGMAGYLPLFLRNSGWSPASADAVFSAYNIAGAVGALLLTTLSDRIGTRRGIVGSILVLTAICVGLLSVVQGAAIWILVILVGFCREAFLALMWTMNFELKEVEVHNAGTAQGLQNSISRPGSIISPPLGNSLAVIGPGTPFIFWSAFAVFALFILLFEKKFNRKCS
jgi:MFS family permease